MPPPGSANKRVYVAVLDDDKNLVRSLSRRLRAVGFQPVTDASAEAFLRNTERRRFDCRGPDIRLPGMPGLELNQAPPATGDATPVIFITADDEPEVGPQAAAGGYSGFLNTNALRERVLKAIRARRPPLRCGRSGYERCRRENRTIRPLGQSRFTFKSSVRIPSAATETRHRRGNA